MVARDHPRGSETYDYIVVGGGSAGCIVAGKLAEADIGRILLVECGSRAEKYPETLRADGYKEAFINDALIWDRFSTPQPGCADRRLFMGSGRGMGGSGSVNGMVYTRGEALDYEEWPRGWKWRDVEPDFRKLEEKLRPRRRTATRFTETCIEAAREAGFRIKADLNDGDLKGVLGYEWMNYETDRRRSSYVAFIRESRLPRLSVETETTASRLLWGKNRQAVGIELIDRSRRCREVRVRREIILSCGALETPKLLMLSGVGPAEELRRQGITVISETPAIGANLHDHPNVTLFFKGQHPVDCHYPQLYGFHRANEKLHLPPGQPDTCYVFYPAPSSFHQALKRMLPTLIPPPWIYLSTPARHGIRLGIDLLFCLPPVKRFVSELYGIVVILGKPLSRGSLGLRSADPFETARIDPAYFREKEDMKTMVEGFRRARKIAAASSLDRWGRREIIPGLKKNTTEQIEKWIAGHAMTTYHYAGTCRMGEEAEAPVDASLLLRGVRGVRIADASAIPSAPVSALNAPSMLIGFRAAEAICKGARSN